MRMFKIEQWSDFVTDNIFTRDTAATHSSCCSDRARFPVRRSPGGEAT